MNKMISLLLALALALTLCACVTPKTPMPIEDGDKSAAQPVTVRLGGLKGPTSMGMVKLFDDADNGVGQNAYTYTIAASANELTPQLVQGELDVLAVPANVAAILYNQTEGGAVYRGKGRRDGNGHCLAERQDHLRHRQGRYPGVRVDLSALAARPDSG